jgi:hypothetical protein
MNRYRVIDYDAKGERLFNLRVEALTKTDARLMAMGAVGAETAQAQRSPTAFFLWLTNYGLDDYFRQQAAMYLQRV